VQSKLHHYILLVFDYTKIMYLSLSNALNLNDSAITRGNSLEARARRHGLRQEVDVNLVHGGEIFHVRQINIVFDHLLERRAGKFENLLQVLQDGSLGLAVHG
jgi:hypothetical protein